MMKHLKLFEEHAAQGEYTLEEMDAFVTELINTMEWSSADVPHWKRVTLNFPSRGGRNASSVSFSKEEAIENWNAAKEFYGKDKNQRWYVWDVQAGGSLNKPKSFSSQRYDINSILDIVKKYPDAMRKMGVSVSSDEMTDFGNMIRRDYYSGGSGSYTGD